MEQKRKPISKDLQETPIRSNLHEANPIKICFSPITLPVSQEICHHSRQNFAGINRHPLFPVVPSSSSLEPQYLHAAAIAGNSANLHHAIAEGGLRWLEFRDRLGRTPLIYACLGNHPECVKVLIKAGASPNSVDCLGRNAFHWAAIRGSYQCFRLMQKHENNSDQSYTQAREESKFCGWRMKDKDGATPLHLSTCASSTKCCQFIIENAVSGDVDAPDDHKRTPLHWASAAGNSQGVKLLLKNNAREDVIDEAGKPPLFYAISSRKINAQQCLKCFMEKSMSSLKWKDSEGRSVLHLAVADQPDGAEIVKILISNGEYSQVKDKVGRTPLHWAAMLNKTQTLMMLLEHCSVMLPCKDEYGATALHYAAMFNYSDTVQLITSSDLFSLETEDVKGRTPLLWAVGNTACEAVLKLVNIGANYDHSDKAGHSALHVSAMQGSVECVKLLLQHGAKVNHKDKVGNTPFASACENGRHDIITILAESGARVDTTNIYGRKPIHLAAYHGHTLIADFLIRLDCDVNCKDVQGLTPLHIACHRGHQDFVSLLSERGAEQNMQDNIGWTPLHYAVYSNHYEVTQFLLDHHANPNIKTTDGETVLDTCYSGGNTMVVKLLLKFGAVASQ